MWRLAQKEKFSHDARTDKGRARAINQDNYIARVVKTSLGPVGIFAVADGMGGLKEGEKAAAIAVEKIAGWADEILPSVFIKKFFSEAVLKSQTKNLLTDINNTILNYAASKNIQAGIAISMLILFKSRYYILHAGDTRVYKYSGKKIRQLTEDETWTAEQVRAGKLTPEEAAVHKNRHALVNCLGVYEETCLRYFTGKARSREVFFLCSDGLYNMVSFNEFYNSTPEKLVKKANECGGIDNITIIMINVN